MEQISEPKPVSIYSRGCCLRQGGEIGGVGGDSYGRDGGGVGTMSPFLSHSAMISGYSYNNRSVLYQCLQLPNSRKLVQQSPTLADRSLDAAHISMSLRGLYCDRVKGDSRRSANCIRIQGYKLLHSTIDGITQFCKCLGVFSSMQREAIVVWDLICITSYLRGKLIEVYKS